MSSIIVYNNPISHNDNIVIKYNNHYYNFTKNHIKKNHIRKCIYNKKLKKQTYFYIGEKIVVDFKKFNRFIKEGNNILELTNIISSGDKYIHKYSNYDVLKLYHSSFYDYMNKSFLLHNKINSKRIIEYFGIEKIKDDKELVNKEIKKLDKVFIEESFKYKDLHKKHTFYCDFRGFLFKNKYIRNFTLLTTSIITLKYNVYKIILEEGLPYIVINETDILLPRNILFEIVLNEEYTLLAKSTKENQFIQKYTLTADLYDIGVLDTSYIENQINRKTLKGGMYNLPLSPNVEVVKLETTLPSIEVSIDDENE